MDCSICLCSHANYKTRCDHWFHRGCLETWVLTEHRAKAIHEDLTCPMCRRDIDGIEILFGPCYDGTDALFGPVPDLFGAASLSSAVVSNSGAASLSSTAARSECPEESARHTRASPPDGRSPTAVSSEPPYTA